MESFFLKLFRIFNFSTGEISTDGKKEIITTGSVVWGVLTRTALIMILALSLNNYFDFRYNWWVILVIMWFFVAFPAYRKYKEFVDKSEEMISGTLCGTCRHFVRSSQLCGIYDEHISEDYIPCEGNNWEPTG